MSKKNGQDQIKMKLPSSLIGRVRDFGSWGEGSKPSWAAQKNTLSSGGIGKLATL